MDSTKNKIETRDNISCEYYNIDKYNNLPPSNGLTIFNMNSRSLNKNFDNITTFISLLNNEFSIMGFTETWLNDNNNTSIININNYRLVEKHRHKRRGGGVCLYIKKNYNYKCRDDLSVFNDSIESLFIEITPQNGSKHYVIGIIYRPPTGSYDDFYFHVQNIYGKLTESRSNSYIMGDFNINLLDDHLSTDFLNLAFSNNFYPAITNPTRVASTSSTLIDNIFTNDDSAINSGIFVTDITDHFPIFLDNNSRLRNYNRDSKRIRNYNINNISNFIFQLECKQ